MFLLFIPIALIGIGAYLWRKDSAASDSPDDDSSAGGGSTLDESKQFTDRQYPPFAASTVALFTKAAQLASLPEEWGAVTSPVHMILAKESNGYVGRPNYQYGAIAALSRIDDWWQVWQALRDSVVNGKDTGSWKSLIDYSQVKGPLPSSATGLGQLTMTNIVNNDYYPSGVNGIGVALEEAIGMLKYIRAAYTTPDNAWAQYNQGHEGY